MCILKRIRNCLPFCKNSGFFNIKLFNIFFVFKKMCMSSFPDDSNCNFHTYTKICSLEKKKLQTQKTKKPILFTYGFIKKPRY